jgi:hypothetical protein
MRVFVGDACIPKKRNISGLEWTMTVVTKLIIGGWISEIGLVCIFALNESGKLLKMHRRLGQWLEWVGPANRDRLLETGLGETGQSEEL